MIIDLALAVVLAAVLEGEQLGVPRERRSALLRRSLLPLPGRCFRMVANPGEAGPTHCPEPVAWRGSWRAPNGRRYRIEACEDHQPVPPEDSETVA